MSNTREKYDVPTVKRLAAGDLSRRLAALVRRAKLEVEDARLVVESLRGRVASLENATNHLDVISEELRAAIMCLETFGHEPQGHDLPLPRGGVYFEHYPTEGE